MLNNLLSNKDSSTGWYIIQFNSIQRYGKATLKCFSIKKVFDGVKKILSIGL